MPASLSPVCPIHQRFYGIWSIYRYCTACGQLDLRVHGCCQSPPILHCLRCEPWFCSCAVKLCDCAFSLSSSPVLLQVMYPGPFGPDSGEIDAVEYGSVARFMNHSTCPNCLFKRVLLGGMIRVLCCTAQFVNEGEELTLNYGSSYWRARE